MLGPQTRIVLLLSEVVQGEVRGGVHVPCLGPDLLPGAGPQHQAEDHHRAQVQVQGDNQPAQKHH